MGKLTVVASLIFWLVRSDRLDFGELRVFWERPDVLAMNVGLWLCGYVALGALRWLILVRGLGLDLTYSRAIRLQMIGLFFNTAMPGAVGGDIIKAFYVIDEQKTKARTRAMLTVLLDRIIGLAALCCLAAIGILANVAFVRETKAMWPLALLVLVGMSALILGLAAVFFPFREEKDPFQKLLSLEVPGFSTLRTIYDALRAYRKRPKLLVGAIAISLIIQTSAIAFAWYVTIVMTGLRTDPAAFASIFSLGVMTTAIPLAPGGLGVGHMAFEKLFSMAGWSSGANIFNVLILGQLSMHLLGFIPYLLYKKKLPSFKATQEVLSQEEVSQEERDPKAMNHTQLSPRDTADINSHS